MSPGLLAAADWFEILAALIFFLITGIAQWVQKRMQQRRDPRHSGGRETLEPLERPVPPRPVSTPPPADDWQEQLRRMLTGEEESFPPVRSQPAPPANPPPPIPTARSTNRPAPPRLPAAPEETSRPWTGEVDESFSWEDQPAPERPLTTLNEAQAAYERGAQVEAKTGSRLTTAASLAAAREAFQKASTLHTRVGNRMHSALARTGSPAAASAGSGNAPRATALGALLHRPGSARQAMLLATILQRPKALE